MRIKKVELSVLNFKERFSNKKHLIEEKSERTTPQLNNSSLEIS